jgi:hypothetical protein
MASGPNCGAAVYEELGAVNLGFIAKDIDLKNFEY